MTREVIDLILGAVQGLGSIAIFLLALFIGIIVLLTVVKFRSTRNTRVVKSLDELVGAPIQYLPPTTPRGRIDQLAGTRR